GGRRRQHENGAREIFQPVHCPRDPADFPREYRLPGRMKKQLIERLIWRGGWRSASSWDFPRPGTTATKDTSTVSAPAPKTRRVSAALAAVVPAIVDVDSR